MLLGRSAPEELAVAIVEAGEEADAQLDVGGAARGGRAFFVAGAAARAEASRGQLRGRQAQRRALRRIVAGRPELRSEVVVVLARPEDDGGQQEQGDRAHSSFVARPWTPSKKPV